LRVSYYEKLLFPLFHGTSSILLDSIRATGLGSHNPHSSLKTIKLLRELISVGEAQSEKDSLNHLGDPLDTESAVDDSVKMIVKVNDSKSYRRFLGEVSAWSRR